MGQNRAVGSPAEHLVAYQHPTGSNGGVHRGPDLYPRINAIRGLLLEALAREGIKLIITEAGRRRRHRSKITMAAAENLITRLQEMVISGTDANVLRLVEVTSAALRPSQHEKNGGGLRPMPATFIRATETEPPPAPSPEPPPPPGTLFANGQEYVGV